ncbi:hypothetical protein [Streptomyces acidiscabies]|uniref:Uncharacterized protein n=1 Tax=Streptomyces acidiscabies TaxID=42234 RepID=A0ABU4LQY4_9ACTN|nr:hypothetical protein [Streptomyces acidiscabies]MDX3017694.1 hypothetical protein [Streptomyces acidiscabies]
MALHKLSLFNHDIPPETRNDLLGLYGLLFNGDLSARAKVLILTLSFTEDGGQIDQERLSKVLGANSKSNVVQRTVAEAERAGYLDVDRTKKPHWYRVIRWDEEDEN